MRRIYFLLLPILIFALLGYAVTPAQAHAVLVDSVPADNSMLATSPSQVELYFSEAIDPNLSKVSVMDANGKKVDAADAHLDPADATHLIVSLTQLGDGVYSVMWAAVSATDGHQTTGSFPFAVGNMAMGSMVVSQTTPTQVPLPAASSSPRSCSISRLLPLSALCCSPSWCGSRLYGRQTLPWAIYPHM